MSDSRRVRKFRLELIGAIPRVPNNRASRVFMESRPTAWLISAFVTWRMRQVPAKPRTIRLWSEGVTPSQFEVAKPRLRALLQKVESGEDLGAHLSYLVDTMGVILPGAQTSDNRGDIDAILTRYGIHHFHIGTPSPQNPKGRSDTLVFAEVTETEFRIIAIADHRIFNQGSPEQRDFSRVCVSYCARDIPPGSGFMLNPVMSSGHSAVVMLFGLKCEAEIKRLDSQLDDPGFIDGLYGGQPILRDGQSVQRPAKPVLTWHFNDLQFGILDRRTMVFFNVFPYFAR